jgi:hypothetical protein
MRIEGVVYPDSHARPIAMPARKGAASLVQISQGRCTRRCGRDSVRRVLAVLTDFEGNSQGESSAGAARVKTTGVIRSIRDVHSGAHSGCAEMKHPRGRS